MSNKRSNSGSTYVCGRFLSEVYMTRCTKAGSGPLVCGLHYAGTRYEPFCDWVEEERVMDWIDGDLGGGGGPGYIIVDCNGDRDGTASDENECNTCIGGNTGLTECPNDFLDDLDDYPCAKDLIASFPTFKGDVADIINNTFGMNDNLNIYFKADPSLIGVLAGKLDRADTLSNGTINYIVTLNPEILQKATKEYILATLYHEALHAYLTHKLLTLGAQVYTNQFGNVDLNNGRIVPLQYHLTMVPFINGLRDAILSLNPSFGSTRATALARLGIVNIDSQDELINLQEEDSSSSGYQGTKCP